MGQIKYQLSNLGIARSWASPRISLYRVTVGKAIMLTWAAGWQFINNYIYFVMLREFPIKWKMLFYIGVMFMYFQVCICSR